MTDGEPQTRMPPLAWVGVLVLIQTGCVYLPSHFLLRTVFRRPAA